MRVLVVALATLLTGCHTMHAAAIDVPPGGAHLAHVVAAVGSSAAAVGLVPVGPRADVAGTWWEPHVVCAFAEPAELELFALGLWVELDEVGVVVRLQQYHPGLAEPPVFRTVLDQLRARLTARVRGIHVREGADAWGPRRRR